MSPFAISTVPRLRACDRIAADLAGLLGDWLSVERELLAALKDKWALTSGGEPATISAQAREESLTSRLNDCQLVRKSLLARVQSAQRFSDGASSRLDLATRVLASESLSQWLFSQRLLLHAAQLVETAVQGPSH